MFQFGGAWSFVWGGLAPKSPPVATGLRGQGELSTVCNCNKRIKTTQPSVTVAWPVVRWGQWAPSFLQFWTANIQIQTLRKNCYDRVKPIIQSTKLQVASFAKVSALKL